MKRFVLLLNLLLAACSSVPPRQLPPVIDGSSGERLPSPEITQPSQPVPPPVEPRKPASGAVLALLDQADDYRRAGDAANEAASIERALRIDARNARLWQRLAAVRLEQGRPQQTEQLALKSNTLATGDRQLQAQNWQLVARARWSMNDSKGARAAEQKAQDLGG